MIGERATVHRGLRPRRPGAGPGRGVEGVGGPAEPLAEGDRATVLSVDGLMVTVAKREALTRIATRMPPQGVQRVLMRRISSGVLGLACVCALVARRARDRQDPQGHERRRQADRVEERRQADRQGRRRHPALRRGRRPRDRRQGQRLHQVGQGLRRDPRRQGRRRDPRPRRRRRIRSTAAPARTRVLADEIEEGVFDCENVEVLEPNDATAERPLGLLQARANWPTPRASSARWRGTPKERYGAATSWRETAAAAGGAGARQPAARGAADRRGGAALRQAASCRAPQTCRSTPSSS